MDPITRQAVTGGKCDWCPDEFEEDDFVGVLPDGTLMCPNCVMDARLWDAAA